MSIHERASRPVDTEINHDIRAAIIREIATSETPLDLRDLLSIIAGDKKSIIQETRAMTGSEIRFVEGTDGKKSGFELIVEEYNDPDSVLV